MNKTGKQVNLLLRQAHAALVVARKDMMIYYFKPPVMIFGVIFPVFFFLAFALGRDLPADAVVPGILAMALFFTASAVGPLVTPWERRAKTYERLVTSPASLEAILGGDVLAGAVFGIIFSLVPLLLGLSVTGARVVSAPGLLCGIVLGGVTFASLGVLMSSPATDNPSQIMMLSNLVRLPLLFVSGVFIPIGRMPAWGRWAAPLSPLSYCTDMVRGAFGEAQYFPVWLDCAALIGFAAGFCILARLMHRRARIKAL